MNACELTGRTATHIMEMSEPACALHVHVAAPFSNLRHAAREAGFDIQPVSGFRDFERQLAIWNGKFLGRRPVCDAVGRKLDVSQMSPAERVDAILLWSALPGASRHHWGTDLDLIDAAGLSPGYRVQLSAAEFSGAGPFARAAEWLEAEAVRFGFFRPFRGVLSGVCAEPWHFSFAPVAEAARRALTPGLLADAVAAADLAGKEEVLSRLDELHSRYVAAIDWP